MELIYTILAVSVLWLAGGILAAVIVGLALLLVWWGIVGIRCLVRRMT
jgi:hypothetical protein